MVVLEFIFTNFWTFAGTVILLSICVNGVVEIVKAISKSRLK